MKPSRKAISVALLVGLVSSASLTACASREDPPLTTHEQLAAARESAVTTLRAVMSLHDGWPSEVPEPAVNDCRIDGQKAIQLTYFVWMRHPDDPKKIVDDAAALWRDEGLIVDTSHAYVGAEGGTDYSANARVKGVPHPSIGASDLMANIYVDSVCVLGDPDDYR